MQTIIFRIIQYKKPLVIGLTSLIVVVFVVWLLGHGFLQAAIEKDTTVSYRRLDDSIIFTKLSTNTTFLPSGDYEVVLEKNGKRSVRNVTIPNLLRGVGLSFSDVNELGAVHILSNPQSEVVYVNDKYYSYSQSPTGRIVSHEINDPLALKNNITSLSESDLNCSILGVLRNELLCRVIDNETDLPGQILGYSMDGLQKSRKNIDDTNSALISNDGRLLTSTKRSMSVYDALNDQARTVNTDVDIARGELDYLSYIGGNRYVLLSGPDYATQETDTVSEVSSWAYSGIYGEITDGKRKSTFEIKTSSPVRFIKMNNSGSLISIQTENELYIYDTHSNKVSFVSSQVNNHDGFWLSNEQFVTLGGVDRVFVYDNSLRQLSTVFHQKNIKLSNIKRVAEKIIMTGYYANAFFSELQAFELSNESKIDNSIYNYFPYNKEGDFSIYIDGTTLYILDAQIGGNSTPQTRVNRTIPEADRYIQEHTRGMTGISVVRL